MSLLKKAMAATPHGATPAKKASDLVAEVVSPVQKPLNFDEVRLAICVPCRDTVTSVFSHNLHTLLQYNWQKGIETKVFYNMSTLLQSQRENLVKAAKSWSATHILWLDSDMSFPFYTAYKLLDHNQPIVAANYVRRQQPYKTVAYPKLYEWDNALTHTQDDPLVKTLIEVEGIGMGCMLTEISIFNTLESPWFEVKWDIETQDYMGEDFNFCTLARSKGVKVLVDDVLSRQIQHLGEFAFGHDLVKK